VIAAVGIDATLAAKAATTTIPIVFVTGADPVAMGLIASLNHPGGNVTGSAVLEAELAPKRLQLLRELLPNATRFGILTDPASSNTQSTIAGLQAPARTLGLQLVFVNARTDGDLEAAFATFRKNVLVRSWSATVPPTICAWNNSRRWRPAMRCPQSSHTLNTLWPAV
jgi:putative tryptophan/tyrosine transport system substrate-binding protein